MKWFVVKLINGLKSMAELYKIFISNIYFRLKGVWDSCQNSNIRSLKSKCRHLIKTLRYNTISQRFPQTGNDGQTNCATWVMFDSRKCYWGRSVTGSSNCKSLEKKMQIRDTRYMTDNIDVTYNRQTYR